MADSGDFVISHWVLPGPDLGGTRFSADHAVLSDFVIAPTPDYYLCCAALAHDRRDSRELVAVWAEPPQGTLDLDVKARIFSGRIFADGFESGDTMRW
jgi:hypothetical protein